MLRIIFVTIDAECRNGRPVDSGCVVGAARDEVLVESGGQVGIGGTLHQTHRIGRFRRFRRPGIFRWDRGSSISQLYDCKSKHINTKHVLSD